MRRFSLSALGFVVAANAFAQMGAATSPSTPGTSLGSGAPSTALPPRQLDCERMKGAEKTKCEKVRGRPTPQPGNGAVPGSSKR